MRLYVSLFLLSAAALAFEILLLRVFAVQEFVHFAYMAITVALLGFGASGTVLALLLRRIAGREAVVYRACALGATLAFVAAPWAAAAIPFEPTELVWQPRQWLFLAALYLVLAAPFVLAAAAIAVSFVWRPGRLAALYAANLLGSGAGALLALAAMAVWPPVRLPASAVLAAGLGAAVVWAARPPAIARNIVAALAVAVALAVAAEPPWSLQITEFKGLPQTLAYPEARRLGERSGPTGWVVAVDAPAGRYAPGLSLAYDGSIPDQVSLFVDGVAAGAATRWEGEPAALEFLDWLTSALPYRVTEPARVAVLGSGGGLEVLNALAHGAGHIDAVELNPDLIALAEAQLDRLSSAYRRPGVRTVVGDARAFMEAGTGTYDVIQLAGLQPFGAAAGGVYAASEDYLHTVEAFRAYLRRLRPGGVLAITRWIRAPARDHLKLLGMARRALVEEGHAEPGNRVALFRGWATGTVMLKPDGFTPAEIARLTGFARSRLIDAAWYPGIDSAAVNVFNRLDDPIYHRAATALFTDRRGWDEFRRDYPFVLDPATDDRPYFGHFLKLTTAPRLLGLAGSQWIPFAEWGYFVLLATFAQAVVLSGLLILAPAALAGPRVGLSHGRWRWLVPYFGAIGLGYLFIEIAAIQKLQLLLGHPVYAVLAVLAAFLVFSGLGSGLVAGRVRRVWMPPLVVALIAPLYLAVMGPLFRGLAGSPLWVRGAVATVALIPLAGSMGVPFPVALSAAAAEERGTVAWAWAVNGYASVIAVTLAGLLAVHLGFRGVLLLAALLYLAAALVIGRAGPRGVAG